MIARIVQKRSITPDLFVLRIAAPSVFIAAKAGQFVNVLPRIGSIDPLLRRPFSIYQKSDSWIEIIIQIHGKGTAELAKHTEGDEVDLIGPLGQPWNIDSGNYKTALLVVGGVGVASMPSLTQVLLDTTIPFATYYGARTSALFADEYLKQIEYATDDGSKGYRGTIIELLRTHLAEERYQLPKLFVCGPNPMMRAAAALAEEFDIPCEVSLETEMACGVGICQGCPVQTTEAEKIASGKSFHLVCTHGPSFEREQIVF